MKSFIVGLSLVSAVAAQLVNGPVSMVPAASTPAATPTPANNGAGTSTAAPSQTTAPPSYSGSSSSVDFYSQMPYSSYQSGGYKSLQCGYGYSKSSDGSCQAESWVCAFFVYFFCSALIFFIFFQYNTQFSGCYATIIIK